MDVFHEKVLIDVAVLFLCGALAVFAGPARAAATSGFVTASVEGFCWVGNNLAERYRASVQPIHESDGADRYAHQRQRCALSIDRFTRKRVRRGVCCCTPDYGL